MDKLMTDTLPDAVHFETDLAKEIIDKDDTRSARLTLSGTQSDDVNKRLARFFRFCANTTRQAWVHLLPMFHLIDKNILGAVTPRARRKLLAELRTQAPNAVPIMPQASDQMETLTRALFLSSVLNPQALRRIEEALRMEGIMRTGSGQHER